LWKKGDEDGAIACYREAIRLNPKSVNSLNDLAWVRAAGPDGMRDGTEAVDLATRACELTGWKNPRFLDTLAAAYAEAGDFEKAVEYQKKAAALAVGDKELEADLRSRIALYERKQPFRDPTLAPRAVAPPPREVKR
jgi:tetratricopeptide (TPR) repeat protein